MMPNVVAILNQKGGVGKTTTTLGLASAAGADGRSVLVVDLDPQGSSSWVLGVDVDQVDTTITDVLSDPATASDAILRSGWSSNVDVIAADGALEACEGIPDGRLAEALKPLADRYDAVLIDCPPSLGSMTRNALTAARFAILVVEPSALGLRGIGAVADLVDEIWDSNNPDLELAGVVLNRVPPVSTEAERRIGELRQIVGAGAVWKPHIRQRVILNEAVAERAPIHAFGARASDSIETFDKLWRRLRRTMAQR